MYSGYRKFAVGVALMLGACAHPGLTVGTLPMAGTLRDSGAEVRAPVALVQFCLEQNACGASVDDGAGASAPLAPGAANAFQRSTSRPEDIFQALLASQVQPQTQAAAGFRFSLTVTRWRELSRVNRQINWDIIPVTDQTAYRTLDRWAMPLTAPRPGVGRRGDCEDYVLEKRQRLIALGWPADALSIAIAIAPGEGLHAVLIAHTDRGDFALDNLHETPMAVETLGYSWLSMQTGANLLRWRGARIGRITQDDLRPRITTFDKHEFEEMPLI